MRPFVFTLLFLLSMSAHARDPWLVAVLAPEPVFPADLVTARYVGKVRVMLTVSAAGTVQAARIVESAHPELTLAVRQAVLHWRFKAWDAQRAKPATLTFPILVLFGARGIEAFSNEVSVGLNNTRCAYLNHEVFAGKRDFPEAPLSHVDVFAYTAEFLASDYVALQIPSPSRRAALLEQFRTSIAQVATRCRREPDTRYAEHLPKDIRELLIDLPTGQARVER